MAKIVIIGAGMMGSAMSVPLRDNGHEVALVGTHLDRDIISTLRRTQVHLGYNRRLPNGVVFYQLEELDAALDGAQYAICGVSSFGVDWFGEQILNRIPADVPILSITKGLLDLPDGTLKTFPEVLACYDKLGHSLNAVGGPCTSYELCDRHQTCVAFCGPDMSVLRDFKALLQTDYYHITLSTDVLGVEAAVALKNAYAVGVSLAIGLAERAEGDNCVPHYNAQAALFGQGVREMRKMLLLLGAGEQNIVYAAGDLYVTVFGGRTRRLGTLLGRGMQIGEALNALAGVTLESTSIAVRVARALKARAARGEANLADFPLMLHIDELLSGSTTVSIPWDKFCLEETVAQ